MKKVLGLLMTLSLATGFNVFAAPTPVKDILTAAQNALTGDVIKAAKGKDKLDDALKEIKDAIKKATDAKLPDIKTSFGKAKEALKNAITDDVKNNAKKEETDLDKAFTVIRNAVVAAATTQKDATGFAGAIDGCIAAMEKNFTEAKATITTNKTTIDKSVIGKIVDEATGAFTKVVDAAEDDATLSINSTEAANPGLLAKIDEFSNEAKKDTKIKVDAFVDKVNSAIKSYINDQLTKNAWYRRAYAAASEFWKNRTTWEKRGIVAGGAALGATALIGTLYATGVLHKLWYKGFSRPAPADQIAAAGYALREVKNNPEETAKLHDAFVNSYGEHNWTRVVQFEANIDKAK